jgi:hypothetical protein
MNTRTWNIIVRIIEVSVIVAVLAAIVYFGIQAFDNISVYK